MMAASASKRIAGILALSAEGWEANWIPTGEDLFRLYGPEEAAFDKSFALPGIEKMKVVQ